MASEGQETAVPPKTLTATTVERPCDAPRRCFICLTDEDVSDLPGTWVDPCPCTLEAHQDCMLAWVTDCERTNKQLKCPVCKSVIEVEGPRDLIVALNDAMHKRFTKASPYVLFTGVSIGVQISLQMYGALALWSFAGKDTMLRYLLNPEMVIDANTGGLRFVRERIWSAIVMMNVAPTLLFSQLLPNLSNKIFLPTASLYGMYQVMHDDTFFAWPPSPQLAMTLFPYVRSVYYNLWREFILPYEVKLNRQILGLPPVDQNDAQQLQAIRQRQAQRNGEGGFIGLLQGLLDALDPGDDDDDDIEANGFDDIEVVHREANNGEEVQDGEVIIELRIEEVEAENHDHNPPHEGNGLQVALNGVGAAEEPDAGEGDNEGDGEGADAHDHLNQVEGPAPALAPDDGLAEFIREVNVVNREDELQHQLRHEAPQAPPARRMGLGALLSSISNSVVSALILPGVSFAMGEVLRLALPKAWTSSTASASSSPWALYAGVGGRPGFFQQQWGRSLVGGCLFVVLKDAIRVYAKSRRVAAMGNRRVKNVDRKRRDK
ncbi:hypothetical protein QQS21_002983 [Conoideocrella luteorostrata]|uniref:RING-CH-type domain-containing protein n=1 Tax=Conoideocrella luteorostrata TaxID=1105319 RepID=A0AAJ0CUB6_9HYPO|nr:hypothetical protein QQS21_002983 [Conoideocrella luteorostrata]